MIDFDECCSMVLPAPLRIGARSPYTACISDYTHNKERPVATRLITGMVVEHIRVNARNRKALEKIISQKKRHGFWQMLLIPGLVAAVGALGLFLL